MTKIGSRLVQAAKEAASIARGEVAPARSFVPADIDVKAVRHKLELGQDAFASEFGFTIHQIRDWEQQRSRPLGAMRAYLMIIDRDPEGIRAILKRQPIVTTKSRTRKAA
jgi:putative transcriptional regulator